MRHRFHIQMLGAAIVLYLAFMGAFVIWKYTHFHYDNLDLAIFNNVLYNSLQGNFFKASIHPPTYLGDHFSPLLIALLPVYALAPGPLLLILLQTLIIGLTSIPIYLIARLVLGKERPWLASGAAVLWLLNPSVQSMNLFEFELTPFAVFFLFWLFYGYLSEKRGLTAVATLAALSAREDVAFVVLGLGIAALIQKRDRFWIWYPIVTSLLYAAFSFSVLQYFSLTHSYKFLGYYGWLGGTTPATIALSFVTHPFKVLTHLLDFKNIEFILGVTFPFFFFVFFRSALWFLLLPPALQIMLAAQGGSVLVLRTHYAGFFLFGLFVLFIFRLRGLSRGSLPNWLKTIVPRKEVWYLLIFSATIYASVTYGPIAPLLMQSRDNNQSAYKKALIDSIPGEAPVAATFELMTPLATRPSLYSLHYAAIGMNQFAQQPYDLPEDTEFLAIDWQDILKTELHVTNHQAFGPYAAQMPLRLRAILSRFALTQASGSITIFQKNESMGAVQQLAALGTNGAFANGTDPLLAAHTTTPHGLALAWALPAEFAPDARYYLSVATNRRQFMLPLGYGLYTNTDLRGATTLTMPLFLAANENQAAITLYRWTDGFLKLSQIGTLEMQNNAERISEAKIVRDIP